MSMQSTYFLVMSMKIDFIDIYLPLQEAVLPGHYHLMSDHHRPQTYRFVQERKYSHVPGLFQGGAAREIHTSLR